MVLLRLLGVALILQSVLTPYSEANVAHNKRIALSLAISKK